MTHYFPIYAGRLGVREKAVCGYYGDAATQHHPDPQCPNCVHLLEKEAEEDRKLDATWRLEDATKPTR